MVSDKELSQVTNVRNITREAKKKRFYKCEALYWKTVSIFFIAIFLVMAIHVFLLERSCQ